MKAKNRLRILYGMESKKTLFFFFVYFIFLQETKQGLVEMVGGKEGRKGEFVLTELSDLFLFLHSTARYRLEKLD